MVREDWFPIPIWSVRTDIDTKYVAEKCLRMRSEGRSNRVRSNYGGWQSTDIIWEENNDLLIVRETIEKYINLLAKEVSKNYDLRLNNTWININEKGNKNLDHVHPWSTFSGTLYIQTDDNTGNIRFTNKWCPSVHYGFQPKESDIFYEFVTYKPKDGMLIFFPSWLNHYVLPNESDLTRISISFNVQQYSGD